ncbi:pyridoxamine 5'-phosphate oxidase family protein, partial [Streptomyces alkaliterrae]|uniref:pyridoxamine 5'-phosphate oxidase family protein n=1 Tax=Streptomyces alkaliterrae TaxID=2213162 RepID=UPI002B1EA949
MAAEPHTTARSGRPGSAGEHEIQRRLDSTRRADRFYDEQLLDHLNERMCEFVADQEMFFLATADARGECDSTFRAGPPGFLRVIDKRTLAFPEYRGNGVHASLGNIQENPHLGILLVDFLNARIGLHVNGTARLVEDDRMRADHPDLPVDPVPGRRPELWVEVTVEEAYIHCSKHIPQLQKAPRRAARAWGTDDVRRKGGDYFGAAAAASTAPAAKAPAAGTPSAAAPAKSDTSAAATKPAPHPGRTGP